LGSAAKNRRRARHEGKAQSAPVRKEKEACPRRSWKKPQGDGKRKKS